MQKVYSYKGRRTLWKRLTPRSIKLITDHTSSPHDQVHRRRSLAHKRSGFPARAPCMYRKTHPRRPGETQVTRCLALRLLQVSKPVPKPSEVVEFLSRPLTWFTSRCRQDAGQRHESPLLGMMCVMGVKKHTRDE